MSGIHCRRIASPEPATPTAKQILARLDFKKELAEEYQTKAWEYVMKNEDRLQNVLDSFYFKSMTKTRVSVVEETEFVGV